MKLLSFATTHSNGRSHHLGALVSGDADSGEIIDLTAAARTLLAHEGLSATGAAQLVDVLAPNSLLAFIQGGSRCRELAEAAIAYVSRVGEEKDPVGAQIRYRADAITHLPAIISPPLLRDFMAFEKHLLNVFPKLNRPIPEEWYKRPVYYKGNPASIGAHRQEIQFPEYAEYLDLEFEFAAIIGKPGVDIAVEQARDHIFGYTIYNDFSARAIQSQEMSVGLGPAKGKDFI
jgi:2-keto-4-pentenoate hydratase/2-oxohepta-3-ene-1,7-dioic acid hydratase in catechol pathway